MSTKTSNQASKQTYPKKKRFGLEVLVVITLAIAFSLLINEVWHEHSWLNATCTEPRTCEECGKTKGTASGHLWVDATYETPKTCTVCSETVGDVLPKPWVYINELDYIAHDGKVWTMSNETPNFDADPDITDAQAHRNEKKPGHTTGPVYDHLGNLYTYGLSVDGVDYKIYEITYYLGGEYDTFSCYVSMTPDVRNDDAVGTGKYFTVYGDGRYLCDSPVMKKDCQAAPYFSVDVSGVQKLTIRYPKTTGPSRMATIFDGKLSVD